MRGMIHQQLKELFWFIHLYPHRTSLQYGPPLYQLVLPASPGDVAWVKVWTVHSGAWREAFDHLQTW